MIDAKPVDSEVLSLLIKSLPGIPSELELYNFARSIEILHGIGADAPPLPATQEPRFV
jgi:hypothetical protein